MGNFGVNFADFAEGLGRGFEQGHKAGIRQIAADKMRSENEKRAKGDAILAGEDTAAPKKGFLGRLNDWVKEGLGRIDPSTAAPGQAGGSGGAIPPTASVSGQTTMTMDTKREPNVQGAIPPTADGRQVTLNDQMPDEGVSRVAYNRGQTGAAPSAQAGAPAGSSGGVPPPSAEPSPQAVAATNRAMVAAGGKPLPIPTGPYAASVPSSVPGPAGPGIIPPRPSMIGVGGSPAGEQENMTGGQFPPLGGPGAPRSVIPPSADSTPQAGPGVRPGAGEPPSMVGAEPPGSVTGESVTRMDTKREGNVIPFGPPRPKGAVPTPEDQTREAQVITLLNQPKPEGQRPQDLIKAITPKGSPEGALPTAAALRDFVDNKIGKLMKIDPERALPLAMAASEALRTGMRDGMMRAHIALQAGDFNTAQKVLMLTYNNYVLDGTKAQFNILPNGKGMTMQLFDEDTGKPIGKPGAITLDMLTGMGLAATNPEAYSKFMQWKDQHRITERGQNMQAGSAAADRAQRKTQFEMTHKLHQDQLTLQWAKLKKDEDKEEALEKRRGAKDAVDAIKTGLEIDKLTSEKNGRIASERGMGDWKMPEAHRKANDATLETVLGDTKALGADFPKATPAQLAQVKGQIMTAATEVLSRNKNMAAEQGADIARRLVKGEKPEVVLGEDGKPLATDDFIVLKYGTAEFAMPRSALAKAQQSTTKPAGAIPPSAGGTTPAAPGQQGAIPATSATGPGKLPAAPPPQSMQELGARDTANDRVKARLAAESKAPETIQSMGRMGIPIPQTATAAPDAMAAVRAQIPAAIQEIQRTRGGSRQDAVRIKANEISKATGVEVSLIINELTRAMSAPRMQAR